MSAFDCTRHLHHMIFLFLRDLNFVFNSSNVIVVFSTEMLRLFVQNLVYLFFLFVIMFAKCSVRFLPSTNGMTFL